LTDIARSVQPPLDPIEMPPGAEREAPSSGDIVGRMTVRSTLDDVRVVNLYCDHWYWSSKFGCIYIVTYYLSPWDNRAGVHRERVVGKLIRGWSKEENGK